MLQGGEDRPTVMRWRRGRREELEERSAVEAHNRTHSSFDSHSGQSGIIARPAACVKKSGTVAGSLPR